MMNCVDLPENTVFRSWVTKNLLWRNGPDPVFTLFGNPEKKFFIGELAPGNGVVGS